MQCNIMRRNIESADIQFILDILPTVQECEIVLPRFSTVSFALTERTCRPSRTLSLLHRPFIPLPQSSYGPLSSEHSKVACSDDLQVNSGEPSVFGDGLTSVITGTTASKIFKVIITIKELPFPIEISNRNHITFSG